MSDLSRQRGENSRPGANAFVEAPEVVFFVRRVNIVVVERKAYEQGVEAERTLEIRDDRYRGAGPHQYGILAPLLRQRTARRGERLHVPVQRNGRRVGVVGEFRATIARQPRRDIV